MVDDKGEYEDEIFELYLDHAKLHIVDRTNWFYSIGLLNESDTESKYLVCASFPKPSNEEKPIGRYVLLLSFVLHGSSIPDITGN